MANITPSQIKTLRKLLKIMQDNKIDISDVIKGTPIGPITMPKNAPANTSDSNSRNEIIRDTNKALGGAATETVLNVAGDAAKLAFGIPAMRRSILGKALMSLHGPGNTALEDVNNSLANARQLRGAGLQAAGGALQLAGDTTSNRLYSMAAKQEADKLRKEAYEFAKNNPDTPGMFYEYQGTVNKHFGDK